MKILPDKVRKWFLASLAYATNRIAAGNIAYPFFKRYGIILLREHYYLPIPLASELSNEVFDRKSALVGLNLMPAQAWQLLTEIYPKFRDEFKAWLTDSVNTKHPYNIANGTFMAADSEIYYSLIRQHHPNTILEIGSGNSTLVASAAISHNLQSRKAETQLISIEPFPNDIIKDGVGSVPHLTRLITKRVEQVELLVFEQLQENDILFIDSTHVLKQGGDVQYIYNEIIPRLKSGVLVHVHDVSLPFPYPKVYADQHLYWNEQYLLQAMLAHNKHYQVIWAGTNMMYAHEHEMKNYFPSIDEMRKRFPQATPSSLWFRIA